MQIDTPTLTYISEILEDYRDDLDTFWDTLDGETNIMDQVGAILLSMNEAKASAQANKELAEMYSARKTMMEERHKSLAKALKTIMLSTGQTKIPHALGTVSLRPGVQSVVIDDETKLPSQLFKVTRTPDKSAIKAALQEGNEIEGATLVTGSQSVSVRMK